MKPIMLSLFMGASAFLPVFAVKTNTWTAASRAGNWASSSNWAENAPLEVGDFVMIPSDMTATMNEEDFSAIPAIGGIIYGEASSVMCFDVEGPQTNIVSWAVNGSGKNQSSGALGKLVKNGSGIIELSLQGPFWYYSNVEVNDGELRLQKSDSYINIFFGKVAVNAPGVLVAPSGCNYARFFCHAGLAGDGVVTNSEDRSKRIYIAGSGSFSGTLAGNFAIYNDNQVTSHQDFLTVGNTGSADHYFNGQSVFGLKSIGGVSADGSTTTYGSIGTGKMYLAMNAGVRYLGEGEVSQGAFLAEANTQSMTIDGGANGNLELVNKIDFSASTGSVARLYLTGANSNGCTLRDCMIANPAGHPCGSGTLSICKRGSGTWKIASSNARFSGLVAVEEGTLQFDSLDEAGTQCSLGLANLLAKDVPYSGDALTDDMLVPYAWILGPAAKDAASTGTLEYVDAEAACCRTRPLAVRGAGRIASSGGALDLSGASAAADGINTLVLAGESGVNVYRNLTDGEAGALAVSKEGAGTWRLAGALTFSGGIDVRGGTLEILRTSSPTEYKYYRFNMKERFEKDGDMPGWATYIDCGKVALFNIGNTMQNIDLVYNGERNGRPWKLMPGEFALQNTSKDFDYANYSFGGIAPAGLFTNPKVDSSGFIRVNDSRYTSSDGTKTAWPWLDDPGSWVRIVFRLNEGHDPIVSYQLGSRWGSEKGASTSCEVHSWSLEGSCDGLNWTELSNVVSNSPGASICSWWGNSATYLNKNPTPWPITTSLASEADAVFPDGTRIGVSPGAVIRVAAQEPVSVNCFTASTEGFGTVEGFAFVAEGTIFLTGEGELKSALIPGTVVNCSGDMSGWSVVYNGKPKPKLTARMTPQGLAVVSPGMTVVVR
jgi:autotransporter-associated beta strand protein